MIKVRDITEDDLLMIMNWRMKPEITKFMNTDPKLTIEGQRKWYKSLNTKKKAKNWIIEENNIPVGLVNLADIDFENKTTSWGYYIGETDKRSLNLAISIEMSLYDYVFDVLGFNSIHNEVLSFNEGVVKLHLACGNSIVRIGKDEIEKNGKKYDVTHMNLTKEHWYEIRKNKKYEKINYGDKL